MSDLNHHLGLLNDQQRFAVAVRAALRSAPLAWAMFPTLSYEYPADQPPIGTPLQQLRVLLALGLASRESTSSGLNLARRLSGEIGSSKLRVVREFCRAIEVFGYFFRDSTKGYVLDANLAATMEIMAEIGAVRQDAHPISNDGGLSITKKIEEFGQQEILDAVAGSEVERPMTEALWAVSNPVADIWTKVRRDWETSGGPGWQFWIDWYEDVLAGRPPNWEMLTEIALIPDNDWNAGPERVNALIAGIAEKHQLRKDVDALKQQIDSLLSVHHKASAAHRSHNGPPELLDEIVYDEYPSISATLGGMSAELAKRDPSPSQLKQLCVNLKNAAIRVLSFCRRLAVVAATSAVAAGGGAAATDLVINQGEHLKRTADLIKDFAMRIDTSNSNN